MKFSYFIPTQQLFCNFLSSNVNVKLRKIQQQQKQQQQKQQHQQQQQQQQQEKYKIIFWKTAE